MLFLLMCFFRALNEVCQAPYELLCWCGVGLGVLGLLYEAKADPTKPQPLHPKPLDP